MAEPDEEPRRLDCTQPGEYALLSILRARAIDKEEMHLTDSARLLLAHLNQTPAAAGMAELLCADWE